MRKKFVTVALLGTLIFTSTNFVGCKDYDDDINKLQEQVDALKSISISDLASQLQSLKDANGNLSVANAKMEAAIAEIKTNIEALKEADKTLTSLVNGKVDQATYQAAIKELNEKCTDLANKVAALASLETAVNDLKANKVDKSVIDELKKTIEKLQSQDSEFATRISKLENTVESLNTVLAGKADQTTVAALSTAIDELKKSVAGVDTKIAAALDPIQKSITKLQEDLAKKADAATVAADIEKVKSEMTAVTDALKTETAANLAAVKAELAGRIAALETAKGQMDVQIGKLETDITALKERITKLENQPATDLNAVKADIAANKTAIDGALSTIGSIQGTITGIEDRLDGLGTEVGAVKKYIDDANSTLNTAITAKIATDIAAAVSSLQSEYAQADAELAGRIETLEGLDVFDKSDYDGLKQNFSSLKETVGNEESGLIKQLNDLEVTVSNLITEALAKTGPGTIDQAIANKIQNTLENSAVIKAAIEAAISDVTGKVDKIDQELNSVLERIQSIVFVPQYKDANGTTIVPAYTINGVNGTVEMTFRIAPAEKVADLVKLALAKPEIFSFYQEDALETRATSESSLKIVAGGVKAGTSAGTIVIKAKVSDGLVDNLYPVALKLATSKEYGTEEEPNSKPVNDVTTDYFNLRVKGITNGTYALSPSSKEIAYTDVEEKPVSLFKVNYTDGSRPLTLAECGFTQNLEVYSIYCTAESRWVVLASTASADVNAIKAELTAKGFEVTKATVKLKSVNINNVGNELKVKLVDNNVFGVNTQSVPNKQFEVTYTVTNNTEGATIAYGSIVKKDLQAGSSNAFTEKNGAFMWSGNASNAAQTFIIKANKANNFTDQLIAGATAQEILDAIKNLASAKVEHKVGNALATAAQPTFNFDVDADKITVTLPANAERKTYAMSTIYHTDLYGDITLTATLNLSYPTAADLLKHQEVRWTDAKTYFLEYDKPAGDAAYLINNELSIGYFYYSNDVDYIYELVPTKDLNGDRTIDARDIPAGVTLVDANKGKIQFTKYVDLSEFRVKLSAKIATNVAASEEFSIKMYYPLSDQISSKDLTYKKEDILLGKKLDVATALNLKDRFGTDVITKGAIVTYGKTVYAMVTGATPVQAGQITFPETDRVRYIVKDGKVGTTDQTLSADEYFEISGGQFSLKKNINLTKPVTVEVEAAVDYVYGTQKSAKFTITIEPTE